MEGIVQAVEHSEPMTLAKCLAYFRQEAMGGDGSNTYVGGRAAFAEIAADLLEVAIKNEAAIPTVLGQGETTWRSAALMLGETLAANGPDGYYNFTPREWLAWVQAAVRAASPAGRSGETRDERRSD